MTRSLDDDDDRKKNRQERERPKKRPTNFKIYFVDFCSFLVFWLSLNNTFRAQGEEQQTVFTDDVSSSSS